MQSVNQIASATFAMLPGSLINNDKGATMVEYGLLVALIAVVVIAALLILGPAISGLFTTVSGSL